MSSSEGLDESDQGGFQIGDPQLLVVKAQRPEVSPVGRAAPARGSVD